MHLIVHSLFIAILVETSSVHLIDNHNYVTGFKKPGFHIHNIKLMISPEMDYWLNTLAYITVCLAPKPQV